MFSWSFHFCLILSLLDILCFRKKLNLMHLYIKRYLRITPPFAAAILFTITFLFYISNGPIWSMIKYSATNYCESYWWTSLLYIQNYVNPGKLCYGHSWYLMVDMQLYFLSPIILYPLWRYGKRFIVFIVLMAAGSMIYVFAVFMVYEFRIATIRQ